MEDKTKLNSLRDTLSRRSMVKNGAVMFGAGLFGSVATTNADGPINGPVFNVSAFGGTGKREDNATGPFRAAVAACTSAGGGVVYVPPGAYTVGTIQLKDHVNLHIEAGATLFLSQNKEDFIAEAETMIFAENAENIAVTGRGTFDGLAQYDFTEMKGVDPEISKEIEIARAAGEDMRRYYRKNSVMNTFMFVLNNCTKVKIHDISVIHSPLWNIRLNDCDQVSVRGIYIFSNLEKGVNADGIDICSSRNVTISDSVIITGDDAIVLKTPLREGKNQANPTENIVVNNCILTSSSTPLMIGTETHADIRHVLFNNCTIRNANKGFGINVQDGGTVSDIIISNLTIETNRRHWNWWGSAEMCKLVLKKREESSRLGQIKNIVIDNIIAHVRGTSTMMGHPEQPLENIRMSNIQIFMKAEDAESKRTTHALEMENVRRLTIRDLSVDWAEDQTEAKWQSAIVLNKVSEVEMVSFSGRQGLKGSDAPTILLKDVSEATIRNSHATEGTHTFIQVQGDASQGIILLDNNTKRAQLGVSYQHERLKNNVEIR